MFKVKDYTFLQIIAHKESGTFLNQEYFTPVLKLIDRHKFKILDDYMPSDALGIIGMINSLYPHFYVILKNGEFLGFISCYDWKGDGLKFHSCFLTAAAERKFYGKATREVFNIFCNYLYNNYGLVKIKAEINKDNVLVKKLLEDCRFKKEGFLKGASKVNGRLQDRLIYGKINYTYLQNLREHNK